MGPEQARLTRLGQRSRPLIFAGTLRPETNYLRLWGTRTRKASSLPQRPSPFFRMRLRVCWQGFGMSLLNRLSAECPPKMRR
jgi:hypothetical protein